MPAYCHNCKNPADTTCIEQLRMVLETGIYSVLVNNCSIV